MINMIDNRHSDLPAAETASRAPASAMSDVGPPPADDLSARLALYVVGRLPADEDAEVRAYVETDAPTCRLVDDARRAMGALIQAVTPVNPSASVRGRLLRRLDESQSPRHHIQHEAQQASPRAPRSHDRVANASSIAAAVALCTIAAIAATLFGQRGVKNTNAPTGPGASRLVDQQQHADAPSTAMAQSSHAPSTDARDAAAPHAPTGVLQLVCGSFFPPPMSGAEQTSAQMGCGRIFLDLDLHMCYLFLPMLKPAENGNSYHLMFTTDADAEPLPIGEFNVDANGHGWFELDVSEQMSTFASAVIRSGPQGEPSRAVDDLLIGRFDQ